MKRLTKRSSKVKTKKVKTRENAVLIEQPLVSEKQIKEVAEQQQSKSRKTTAVRIKCMKCDTALIAPIPNVKQGFGAIRCQQCGMFDYFYGEYIIEDENYNEYDTNDVITEIFFDMLAEKKSFEEIQKETGLLKVEEDESQTVLTLYYPNGEIVSHWV